MVDENHPDDVWKDWMGEPEGAEPEKTTEAEPDQSQSNDWDWENANLSSGNIKDINHMYSRHPHSAYQRRRRNR